MILKTTKIEDLPYYKIFSEKERLVSRCREPYYCNNCGKVVFYSDVMNLGDFIKHLYLAWVCPKCKDKYQKSFDSKREKHFGKNKQSTNKKR